MSLKTNEEILGGLTLFPAAPTIANYRARSSPTRPGTRATSTRSIYVAMNTVLSRCVALPAAYAFSRYSFLGDKHMFFWLLTNRMSPPAVFLLPFFQLYQTIGLFDTHLAVALAHCLFNVPLAVWILEGFMSGVPQEIDETAYLDGYSFPRFFLRIFLPLIRVRRRRHGLLLLHVQLGRAAAGAHADLGQRQADRRDDDAHGRRAGMDWGMLAAAGVLTIVPGALVIWFVRNYIAKGFALGRV